MPLHVCLCAASFRALHHTITWCTACRADGKHLHNRRTRKARAERARRRQAETARIDAMLAHQDAIKRRQRWRSA